MNPLMFRFSINAYVFTAFAGHCSEPCFWTPRLLDAETSDTCMDIVQPFKSRRDTETSIGGSFSGTKYRLPG